VHADHRPDRRTELRKIHPTHSRTRTSPTHRNCRNGKDLSGDDAGQAASVLSGGVEDLWTNDYADLVSLA
jgi:hypothetical protein